MADEAKENAPAPNPYVYIADLKAHIRERDMVVERIAAADAGPATSDLEELKAHQELINRRRAALAEMPVPYGIMSISTVTKTWSFVHGEWVMYEEVHEISESPRRQLQCGGRTLWWDDKYELDGACMVDDSYISTAGMGVAGIYVIQERVFCVAGGTGILEWVNRKWESRFGGVDNTFLVSDADRFHIFIAMDKGKIMIFDPIQRVCVGNIPYTITEPTHMWVDNDVLILMGRDRRSWECVWADPERSGRTKMPPFRNEAAMGTNVWYCRGEKHERRPH